MRYLFLCLFLYVIAVGNVAAQPDSVLHTSYAKRYNYVYEFGGAIGRLKNPKKVLDSLQQMIKKAEDTGDKKLAFQLSVIKIHMPYYMDSIGSTEEFLNQIKEADLKGYIYEATGARVKVAAHLWGDDDKSKAMEHALKAYDMYRAFSVDSFPERITAQWNLAGYYYYFHDYNRVKELLLELDEATSWKLDEIKAGVLVTLALSYRELGDYDSAEYHFLRAYNSKTINITKKALTAGNIGTTYLLKGNVPKALEWLKKELEIWKGINGNTNMASLVAYTCVADCYLKTGKLALAKKYVDSATALTPNVRRSYFNLKNLYSTKATILRELGDYQSAFICIDSFLVLNDSFYKRRDKGKLVAAEKRVQAAVLEGELIYLEGERKSSIWIRNFAIAAILFLATVTLLLVNRSRLKHKEKELRAINEKAKAENKLLIFTRQVQEQNQEIDNLNEELKNLSDTHDVTAQNEKIAQLQHATILTDEQWDDFKISFEEVYTGFINKVKGRFPNITPAELRYITLLKLNLSNKEMANVLGVNINTVHNYKSRMKRKYSLPDDTDIEDVIENI